MNAHFPATGSSLLDALWHLATGFVMVLPARRRVLLWLGPVLALGLDVDHLFGSVLPAVVGRPAHDLIFVALISISFTLWKRLQVGLLAAGAVFAHISVDGGTFPLLSPLSRTAYALPYSVEVALIGLAMLLFFLSVQPARSLRSWRTGGVFLVGLVGLSLVLWFGGALLLTSFTLS